MIINHNLTALNTHRQLGMVSSAATKSMERLSSGMRINKAADDAAGLSISEKMRSQIRGLEQAQRNAQDGISLIQTAEGGLNETHSILQRVRELVVQAGNQTNTGEELANIQAEITQLVEEIDAIAERTEFNGKKLLNGGLETDGVTLQIGANGTQQLNFTIGDMSSVGLDLATKDADNNITASIDVTAFENNAPDEPNVGFDAQLALVDEAIKSVATQRSSLGAVQNRLEHTINNLSTSAENLTAAESRIRDVDMAKEMMEFTKNNILTQAAQAMLAQANQQPQAILQLLR